MWESPIETQKSSSRSDQKSSLHQQRLMVKDQREQEEIKQATTQFLGLNGPMELIKGKPFAVEWSH